MISAALEEENFTQAMDHLAQLRGAVDAFFEAVQVNSDNDIIRRNRLNILSRIRHIGTITADLTKIEG